ncbi:MAG TPA: thiopurine S-methyltransferase [Gammaproteobacteria bacterium]|nr:thiopurine S-methyltransferase [Gammaproteobacteria bacterium]
MDPRFWRERWLRNQIGFHQDRVNPHLQRYFDRLDLEPGDPVFVPLCGKSLDMLWLAQQGYRVVGAEISEVAVGAFFREQGLAPERQDRGAYVRYRDGAITVLQGDFFHLQAVDLGPVRAVYDRASLIALPPRLREDYAHRMGQLFPSGIRTLLITLEYPQEEMDGPPFSVSDAEVAALFRHRHHCTLLHAEDVLQQAPRFRDRGLTRLYEKVFLLEPRR